jgi:hypothetical protein
VNVQAPPMLIGSMCHSFTWRFVIAGQYRDCCDGLRQITGRKSPGAEAGIGARRSRTAAMLLCDREGTLGGRSVAERKVTGSPLRRQAR